MVKLILNGLQFNFSQSSNSMLKSIEKNVSLSLPPPFSLLVLISLITRFLFYFYSHVKEFFLLNNAFNKFLNYQNFSSLINTKTAKICLIDLSVKRRVTEPINILDKKLNCSEKTLQEGWIKMKKILIVFFCMIIVSANIFAQSALQGNGNGGKDKIGGWLGFPIVGLVRII